MRKRFLIEGMRCSTCVQVNEDFIKSIEGVEKIYINFSTNYAHIEYDSDWVSFEEIKNKIELNGYNVKEEELIKISKDLAFKKFVYSLFFSIPVFFIYLIHINTSHSFYGISLKIIMLILSSIVVFIFGSHFHINAYKSLKKFRINMDSLVSLGALTALIYSIIASFFPGSTLYFEASVAIITFINFGKYLEEIVKTKTGNAISKLHKLGSKNVNVLVHHKIISKDINDVKVGEIILIRPGEKIPLDGIIIEGSSNVDESLLTGESIPIYKELNYECFGGTINLNGTIKLKVIKNFEDGTLSHIINLIKDAQNSKAHIQKTVDKISSIFVPGIIFISIIAFISWYLITGDIARSIIVAVSSLIIACPCALGLATPTAILVGIGVGAKEGIIIKNAEALEKTKNIDVILFDKTGTLTEGRPGVTDIISYIGTEDDLIVLAKSLGVLSTHPLSKYIINYRIDLAELEVTNLKEFSGRGISGIINGEMIMMGNMKFFEKININNKISEKLNELANVGITPIIIGSETEIYGIIGLLDLPKPGAEITISQLHSMGIEIIMLTGDFKKNAEFIASKIGIDKVIAEVLPKDKLDIVKSIQKTGKKVAFVGDGINDAAALTKSDLGISMGTGSDIAIENSDIVLVQGNLEKVGTSIRLSRCTLKTIKQNLFWAFIYNIIGISLAVFGIINPIFASFAMSISSISVILNSLRLKKFK